MSIRRQSLPARICRVAYKIAAPALFSRLEFESLSRSSALHRGRDPLRKSWASTQGGGVVLSRRTRRRCARSGFPQCGKTLSFARKSGHSRHHGGSWNGSRAVSRVFAGAKGGRGKRKKKLALFGSQHGTAISLGAMSSRRSKKREF